VRPVRTPYKVGVLVDIPGTPGLSDAFPEGVRFGLDLAHEQGHVDRPVEVVVREAYGQPWSDAQPVIDAFAELADEGVLAIAGPFASDNCMAILPEVERVGLSTIAMCGTTEFVGPYAFILPNGSLADEPEIIASWLAANHHTRIAVLAERPSQITDEYLRYFGWAAAEHGLKVIHEVGVPPAGGADEVKEAMLELAASEPDALAYLGFGSLYKHLAPALDASGWDPPRITGTAFIGATYNRRFAECLEGWVGVDQYDERNRRLQEVVAELERRGRLAVPNSSTSVGFDIGSVLGRALGRMTPATRAGLRAAIETVRGVPASSGAPGNLITFGPWDHRGFKGVYQVLRRAEGGTTHFVGVPTVDN
jgi:ABC-type branched-subunit amino acid transport system substrate-binding protein